MELDWIKEGINYWENPNCPREYLENALVELVEFVEGEKVRDDIIKAMSREKLVERISFYEYVSEK